MEEQYTLRDYLQGKVAITIGDETIKSICFDREVEADTPMSDVTMKQRDLTLADLYMYCANLPTSTGTIDDKNGVWEHKEGSVTMSAADKKAMRRMAYWLYRKWGVLMQSLSSINVVNRGFKKCTQPPL